MKESIVLLGHGSPKKDANNLDHMAAMLHTMLHAGCTWDSPFLPLFYKILIAFIPTQMPLGILEGAMTAGMVVLLHKKRPDLLVRMRVLKPEEVAA